MEVCKPELAAPGEGTGFQRIMYTRDVCTGDDKEVNDSLESFPSGHSTAAFAGFVFLTLYLSGLFSKQVSRRRVLDPDVEKPIQTLNSRSSAIVDRRTGRSS